MQSEERVLCQRLGTRPATEERVTVCVHLQAMTARSCDSGPTGPFNSGTTSEMMSSLAKARGNGCHGRELDR